ncbi:MAG: peptidylprolyl isomerase, partial [Candidatus Rokuibacteriota bacterium]
LPDTVDRIVAIVGSTVILASEVDEELFARFPLGEGLPREGSEERKNFARQILQELIDLELVYQRAATDTMVKVTEEQVNSAVDEQMRNIRQRFPSDEAYREEIRITGFQTPDEYRRWLTERQRKQLMTSMLVEQLKATGKLKPVIPTEREMRAFFEAQKGSQNRPETISFRQIIIVPKPSPEAKTRALALADSILVELRKGADFATTARRFSMDPQSKEQGGSLGWFRRGAMHAAFEDVAFALRPGFVSDPVETPHGYHLIQVERVQPAEVMARHILIMPEITPADADSGRALAERVRALLVAGTSVDSLQRLYHDPLEERDGRNFPVDRLPAPYAAMLKDLLAPAVSAVFALPIPGVDSLRGKYAVVSLEDRLAAGELRYEDVKDRIRSQLGDQMALRRMIDGLRQATYVEVRGP